MTAIAEIPLRGPSGEPVDLWRTLYSHGIAHLPPMLVDEAASGFEVTLPVPGGRPRVVTVSSGRPGHVDVSVAGRAPGARAARALVATVRRILNLDEDLAPFYEVARADPDLEWVAATGAGRMIRSPTVFEDVVKTLATTNCSWALTKVMTTALVQHVGEPAVGAPADGWRGRTFPSPEAMATRDERFYRDVVRAGYRAPHFMGLARGVAEGTIDLERLRHPEIPEEEVELALLALPGIGPYAAAHIMLLLGRYSSLILDSWTRPTYAKLSGARRAVPDATILRRFRKYGRYAGLAFWLYLTRGWVEENPL